MIRSGAIAALCALALRHVAFAQGPEVYGPPAPPSPPDGYRREIAGEGDLRFIVWRAPAPGGPLLVAAEDEPSPSSFGSPDLLALARKRNMTLLFLGQAPPEKGAEGLRAIIRRLRQGKGAIGMGARRGADLLRRLSFETQDKIFDALLLEAPPVSAPPRKTAPFVIEIFGSEAYWRAAAPAPFTDAANRRRFFLAGAALAPDSQHGCGNLANDRSLEPARRALLAALDEFLSSGLAPPASRQAELTPARNLAFPKIPGLPAPPQDAGLVPKIDADGNETSGLRLPDQALPVATFTAWGDGGGGCGAGMKFPFPLSRAAREAARDPRQSLPERYGSRAYFVAALRSVSEKLVKERLLLQEDADAYVAAGKKAPF